MGRKVDERHEDAEEAEDVEDEDGALDCRESAADDGVDEEDERDGRVEEEGALPELGVVARPDEGDEALDQGAVQVAC